MTIESLFKWLDGGRFYNGIALLLSVAGFVVSIGGIWVAAYQATRSRRAAEAAREAARETSQRLRAFTTAIDFSKVSAHWQTVLQSLRTGHFETACLRCEDVREILGHARADELTAKLLPKAKWQALLADIATTQRSIEALFNRLPSPEDRTSVISVSVEISERINAVVGKTKSLAQDKTVTYADS